MNGVDAFKAVAAYCDVALVSLSGPAGYVNGGHAARRLFQDAWVHQTKGAHDGQDEGPVRVRKGEGRRGV